MDILGVIKGRRSIRKFEKRSVPPESLEKLVEAAIWAPSSHSSEPCEFIVTATPGGVAELARLSHAKFIEGAPVIITLVVRTDTGSKSPIMDGSAAAMNLLLEAHALGLGCCWISAHPWETKLRHALNIPDDCRVIGSFAVGFPAESPLGARRTSPQEATHEERYRREHV